jgi:hypothetical protein
VCLAAHTSGGLKSHATRGPGLLSKGGGNASLAKGAGRYGVVYLWMVSELFFYQLVLIALLWLCLMLHWAWPSDAATCPTTPEPTPPAPKRHREIKPFAGLTTKPHCDACAHASDLRSEAPCPPPPRIVMTRGRRREVDTSHHFCPNPDCASRGWGGWGNLRANGHPRGGPWRQLLCIACRRYFLETLGTLFQGKRASVELIVRVIACLARRGHPGHSAGVRGRSEDGAAGAGGGGRAAPRLLPRCPARRARHTGPTR